MIRMKTDCGAITVDNAVYTNIAGYAATNCFGVKGMAVRSMTDGLVHLLRREAMSKGVKVTFHEEGRISIDLHIMMDKGVNISAICSSIIQRGPLFRHKVHRYRGPGRQRLCRLHYH